MPVETDSLTEVNKAIASGFVLLGKLDSKLSKLIECDWNPHDVSCWTAARNEICQSTKALVESAMTHYVRVK